MGIAAVPAIFAQLAGGSQGWAAPDEGKGGLGAEGIWGWQVWGEGVQLGERLLFVSRHMEFIRDCVFSARWGWMGLSVPSCLVAEGGGQDVGRDPKISSCAMLGAVPTPSGPSRGTQRPQRSPSSLWEEGRERVGHGGALFGMGISTLPEQSMVVSPPPHRTCRQIFVPRLRGTARRNFILAPTCGSTAWH